MPSILWQKTLIGLSSTDGFPIYFPDTDIRPFAVTVATYSASNTYNVEHTLDYTGSSTFISTGATWFQNSTQSGAAGVSLLSNYGFPVGAIRLNVTAGSTTNAGVTMKILQAG
jgi:hypothetical protein